MDYDSVRNLLKDLGWRPGPAGCVVITRAQQPPAVAGEGEDIVWIRQAGGGPLDAPPDRWAVAVVFDLFEPARKRQAAHLLAQLRDRVADKTIIRDNGGVFTPAELLALGYIEERRPRAGGRFFVHDPALFYEPRKWNNAEHWANPENFDKYRF